MKPLLLILLLVFASGAFAAPADYRVYYVKGTVVKKGGAKSLRRGDSLYVQDILQLSANAEVFLVCRDFSLVQFRKPGSYTLRTAAPCPGKRGSLTASYFKYVWEELRSHHGSPENNPRHYMRNKGAVSRGDCPVAGISFFADTIYAAPGQDLSLCWKVLIAEPFLSIYPDEHDPVPLTQLALHNGKPLKLKKLIEHASEQGETYWYITSQNPGVCNRNYLKIFSLAEYNALVNQLLQNVVTTTPAETAYMKGFILEEHHFLSEALKYYAKAFQIDPKNPRTRAALNRCHEIN